MLIVDFIGYPGSGKSTVAGQLVAQLNDIGVTAKLVPVTELGYSSVSSPLSFRHKVKSRFESFWYDPYLALLYYSLAISLWSHPLRRMQAVHQYLQRWKKACELLSHTSEQVVVFDEWLLHGFFSMSFGSSRPPKGRIMEMIYRHTYCCFEHRIVHFKVPLEVCFQRVMSRKPPSSRFNSEMSEDMAKEYCASFSLYDLIIEVTEKSTDNKLITISSESDVAALPGNIASEVRSETAPT